MSRFATPLGPKSARAKEIRRCIAVFMARDMRPFSIIENEGVWQLVTHWNPNTPSHHTMEKRGSRYLRYALFNGTKIVCRYESTFKKYLSKKRKEGKHYYVAISHAAKKLLRVIYHLEKNKEAYQMQR